MSQDKNTQNKKTKMTSKQIFAIIGIILLVLLYVSTKPFLLYICITVKPIFSSVS